MAFQIAKTTQMNCIVMLTALLESFSASFLHIASTNIHMPNGLALDKTQRKLYWADARLDKIEVCNMDGTNCQILVKSAAEHPFDLAVYDEFLFFTDWVLQAVVRINKITGNSI